MRTEQVDLLVIGAGPAGLAAATVAAKQGLRVLVVDEQGAPGGQLRAELVRTDGPDGRLAWRAGQVEAERLAAIAMATGVRFCCGVSVWGLFPGWEAYVQPVDPTALVPDRIQAAAVIVAAGAVANPLCLPGWTLPGVMNLDAALRLTNLYRVRCGQRAVVIGTDLRAQQAAEQLALSGVEVLAVLPPAPGHWLLPAAGAEPVVSLPGIPLRLECAVVAIQGEQSVCGVQVVDLDPAGNVIQTPMTEWTVDTVITSAGYFPLVELVQLAGAPVVHIPELGGHVPLCGPSLETAVPGLFVAGSITGPVDRSLAAAQGDLSGLCATAYLGRIAWHDARLTAAQARARAAREQYQVRQPDVRLGWAQLETLWGDHVGSVAPPR
jgi:sarcosine oxidase subunit alpha